MSKTIKSSDGKPRCEWCNAAPEFLAYHDKEWGFPVKNDQRLFEKICLECFQSGLSWRTILAKRENFRAAFHNFDFNKIAKFTQRDVTRLLKDESIVRHRGKNEATINNAKQVKKLIKEEGSLSAFIWKYEPKKTYSPQSTSTSEESIALSNELKKRGWKFVGPTTMYAFMQAMGLFNDHVKGCIIRAEVENARKKFKRPK